MGTRGSYGVHIDGEDILTYNHWDSYPSGLGEEILKQTKALIAEVGLPEMKYLAVNMERLKVGDTPTDKQKEKYKKFADLSVSNQSLDDLYCLLRNFQGRLDLNLTQGVILEDSEFVYDSLFCEWAYIINFDTNMFEVYTGFNQDSNAAGRFTHRGNRDYFGVALVREFPLDNLPESIATLERELSDEEEDEE